MGLFGTSCSSGTLAASQHLAPLIEACCIILGNLSLYCNRPTNVLLMHGCFAMSDRLLIDHQINQFCVNNANKEICTLHTCPASPLVWTFFYTTYSFNLKHTFSRKKSYEAILTVLSKFRIFKQQQQSGLFQWSFVCWPVFPQCSIFLT